MVDGPRPVPGAADAPVVSVIIATYNWSSALRCAIHSALLQTLQNIEIIVVGDGCTDDSEAVARSFGDARIRWINLQHRQGHQFGPNNEGLRNARAEWVAYLGHDDIWYPTHLESALRTATEKAADWVAGTTLFYGPPGSGLRGITGLFRSGELEPPEWAPPSSWVHRRSLVDKAGYWTDPTTLSLPSDVDFMNRLLAMGIRIACTNELTVFKFNANRRDTYKIKTNDEQQAFLQKVQSGVDFRQDELGKLTRSITLGKLMTIVMPGAEVRAAPGAVHQWYQRLKGTQARFRQDELRTLERRERFPIPDHLGWLEWYPEEIDPRFGKYRWSGPQARSTIDLPIRMDRELVVRIHVMRAVSAGLLPPRVKVGQDDVPVRMKRTYRRTYMLTACTGIAESSDASVSVTLEIEQTLRPSALGLGNDDRWLGLAVNWIELEPASKISSFRRTTELLHRAVSFLRLKFRR